jgi:hypothetical protein
MTRVWVDPVDGQTVYASWLQNGKSDTVVAKSTDFGVTWSVIVANHTNAATDKPILAVRGPDVYVAYNHAQKIWVSASHDGGATFTSVNIKKTGVLGWALAGGGTVDPAGNVYIGWAGYEQSGGAKGPVNLFISKSTDGGKTWTNMVIDVSGSPPDCSEFLCGWAFLGAQVTVASDADGKLYALWNASAKGHDKGLSALLAVKRRETRSAKKCFGGAGSITPSRRWQPVRLGYSHLLDGRRTGHWNTYYRSSTDSGDSWSTEADLSTYLAGFDYIFPDGFGFPFGDYYELDIDDQGSTHAVWGEGLNYDSPGSIWYTTGR